MTRLSLSFGTRTVAPCAALWIACFLFSAPVFAHHSGAIFDPAKSVSLNGTVREFQWTMPHCWIQILVPDADGKTTEWSVEMGAPFQLYQGGLRPASLKPGDKISVVIHPMRDGSSGGMFVSGADANGNPIGKRP